MNDQNESYMEQCNDLNESHILRRRFPLTSTAYKYLDIGVRASLSSHVEIVLSDNRGHQIILSHTTWTVFIENRENIENFLQSDIFNSPLHVDDLNVELVKWERQKMVKLTHDTYPDIYLIMKLETLRYLFKIEKCVEHVYYELSNKTHSVSEKYKRFVDIIKIINAKFDCITDYKPDAMIEIMHTVSDKSQIECELLAFAMDNILHDALD